jgi:hypothetical protein
MVGLDDVVQILDLAMQRLLYPGLAGRR